MIAILILAADIANAPVRLSDAEKARCVARQGRVAMINLHQDEGCILPMSDAGKACTDGSQCKAGCTVDPQRPPRRAKDKIVGICAPTNAGFGCRQPVEKGRAGLAMCID